MVERLVPDLTAEWKTVRRLADAMLECTDNAVDELVAGLGTEGTEEQMEELADRVFELAATGEAPPEVPLVLECADCGLLARSIKQAFDHITEVDTDPDNPHGGWDPVELPKEASHG